MILYVTEPDEETGMVAAITDMPCACGWPETILHMFVDGRVMRGCASCEVEHDVTATFDPLDPTYQADGSSDA